MRAVSFRFGVWLVTPPSNFVHNVPQQRQMEARAMDVLESLVARRG